jgi:hypothetical protein
MSVIITSRHCNCGLPQVSLYHTPALRGILRSLMPQRYNEVIGLQHMKVYLFDNSLLISGWVIYLYMYIYRQVHVWIQITYIQYFLDRKVPVLRYGKRVVTLLSLNRKKEMAILLLDVKVKTLYCDMMTDKDSHCSVTTQVFASVSTHTTVKELLEIVFCIWSDLMLYSKLPSAVAFIPVWRRGRIPPPWPCES